MILIYKKYDPKLDGNRILTKITNDDKYFIIRQSQSSESTYNKTSPDTTKTTETTNTTATTYDEDVDDCNYDSDCSNNFNCSTLDKDDENVTKLFKTIKKVLRYNFCINKQGKYTKSTSFKELQTSIKRLLSTDSLDKMKIDILKRIDSDIDSNIDFNKDYKDPIKQIEKKINRYLYDYNNSKKNTISENTISENTISENIVVNNTKKKFILSPETKIQQKANQAKANDTNKANSKNGQKKAERAKAEEAKAANSKRKEEEKQRRILAELKRESNQEKLKIYKSILLTDIELLMINFMNLLNQFYEDYLLSQDLYKTIKSKIIELYVYNNKKMTPENKEPAKSNNSKITKKQYNEESKDIVKKYLKTGTDASFKRDSEEY
jgi:hypothetical protein